MEFRQHASNETTALLERVLAQTSEQSRREVQTLRGAMDAAFQSIEETLQAAAHLEGDDEISSLVERLASTAIGHAQALVDRAKVEAETTIEALRGELREQLRRNEALAATAAESAATADYLRTQLRGEAERAEAAAAERIRLEAAGVDLDRARREAESLREQETQAKNALEAQLLHLRSELEASRAETAAALAECASVTQALEASEKQRHAPTLAGQSFDRLLTTFQKLAGAASRNDVFLALVDALATEFSRVALFAVSGSRLVGAHQAGFDFKSDVTSIVTPLTIDSVLTRAAKAGRIEAARVGDTADATRASLGGSPTFVLAVPILVRGKPLAVIYCDDSGRPVSEHVTPEQCRRFAEVLVWQAMPTLTRLSVDPAALNELREYAAMLVNEVGHMYSADVADGATADQLQHRLRENVRCARQIYAQRVALEGPFAATLLEEQLGLLTQAGTSFARDLGALLGRSSTTLEPDTQPAKSQ